MLTPTTVESTPTMQPVIFDDFATPTTEHDCAIQELEAQRFEHGVDEDGMLGRY